MALLRVVDVVAHAGPDGPLLVRFLYVHPGYFRYFYPGYFRYSPSLGSFTGKPRMFLFPSRWRQAAGPAVRLHPAQVRQLHGKR